MSDHARASAFAAPLALLLSSGVPALAIAAPLDARPVETAVTASVSAGSSAGFPAANDPVLRGLVDEALARRPELARVEAVIRAERERTVRAGALPDPSISVGIQNDGFTSIEIGNMETSFVSIMASQTFPWPGKRDLRTELARFGVSAAEVELARARLTTEADVRRAYVALLLVRSRLALLEELSSLWRQSAETAKARYEAGEVPQSDLLRAQLERARLEKRRWALAAEERVTADELNRLRARPSGTPIVTSTKLEALPAPAEPAPDRELDDALAASPELRAARLAVAREEKGTALAEKELYPDIGVSVGVMPRGDLPPMWQANVSVTLPIFAGSKQDRAIEESRLRRDAEAHGAEAVDLQLRQAIESRAVALRTLLDTIALYRNGLLVQARATAESTLAQYRVGRVTFAAVLEAVAGYLGDQDELLATLAEAQRVAIARDELSLASSSLGGAALASRSMPGAGAMGAGRRAASASTNTTAAPNEAQSGSMGGM